MGHTSTRDGRRKRIYDKMAALWRRVQGSGALDTRQPSTVAVRVDGINPADLTPQANAIQMQRLDLAQAKTEALARHIDLEAS